MGKRGRRRGSDALAAPERRYESPDGDALVLREHLAEHFPDVEAP